MRIHLTLPGMRKKTVRLTLKISAADMFDDMIVAPHNEINDRIFDNIDRFTRRGHFTGDLSIAIYTDSVSPIIQEKFRELFLEHYEDDLKEARAALIMRLMLLFLFIVLSVVNIALWEHLKGRLLLSVFQNIWAFMLWKIGDTFIDGVQKWRNYRRIELIKQAEIRFYRIKGKRAAD